MPELVFDGYPAAGPITGHYLETGNGWTPDHPHLGVDIGCPTGTPVYARAPGIVRLHKPGDGWGDGSFGNCVVLDHEDTPWYSITAHMSAFVVADGQRVGRGELLGASGATGMVSGPHVHWQVSKTPGFPRDTSLTADPVSFIATTKEEESSMTTAEQAALEERVDTLETIVRRIDTKGVILYTDGAGYDVIAPVRDLNTAVKALAESLDAHVNP